MRAIVGVLAAVCSLAVPQVGNAQTQQGSAAAAVDYKDPGTSTLIGVLVTGGGQMYSGETNKGLTLLGIGAGSLIAGEVLTAASCTTSGYASNCSLAPFAVGSLVYVGTWIYGLLDAGDAARRHNASAGLKTARVTPALQRMKAGSGDAAGVGLRIEF